MTKPFSQRPPVHEREFHSILRDVASDQGTPAFRSGVAALRTLTTTRSPEVVSTKLDGVFRNPNKVKLPSGVSEMRLRVNLLRAVGELRHPALISLIQDHGLRSKEVPIRRAALLAAGKLGQHGESLLPLVASSIMHPHPFVRDAALQAHTRLNVRAVSSYPSPFPRDGFHLTPVANGKPFGSRKNKVAYV